VPSVSQSVGRSQSVIISRKAVSKKRGKERILLGRDLQERREAEGSINTGKMPRH
jgi:hypothetical protein